MNEPNEFSRPVKLDAIGTGKIVHDIAANEDECRALAARFDLLSLDSLTAAISLAKTAKGIEAKGQVKAQLTQACTVTGEPVPSDINETLSLLFIAAPDGHNIDVDEEIELDEEECESMFHDGKTVDIGEAAAQTMGLALNPYPRGKSADEKLRAAGVKTEDEEKAASGPFAALAALKGKS